MRCGYNSEEMLNLFKVYAKKIKYFEIKNILKLVYGLIVKKKIIISGLNSGKCLENAMIDACKNKKIKNMNEIKKTLLIPAVDIKNGKIYNFISKEKRINLSNENIIIENMDIVKAVRASCSYPLVFEPCFYKNIELVDGAIRENIPWRGLKKLGADKVISICFEKDVPDNCCNNMIEVLSNSIDILCHELSLYEINGVDYVIKIKTKDIGLLDVNKIDYLYNIGYEKVKKEMDKIKKKFF